MKTKSIGLVMAVCILLAGCGKKSSPPENSTVPPKSPVATGGGQYQIGGVGAQLGAKQRGEPLKVISVVPDSPAAKAGLKAGFRILTIDGAPTAGRTLADCVNLIRGEAGTKVKFTVVDTDSGQTNDMVLTRETITFK